MQRETHMHTCTCRDLLLGDPPELASKMMEVVSRERKRTQTIRKGKHEQMKTTKTTTKQSRQKRAAHEKTSSPAAPILAYWQSTYHSGTILIINLSAMVTLLLLNALFQRHVLTVCRVTEQGGGGWHPFCDGKWQAGAWRTIE
jgi:hypothetical protein